MGRKKIKKESIKFKNNRHSYYNLKYNLLLVTKDKKEFINLEITKKLENIFKEQLENKNGSLLDFHTKGNLVYLYFEVPPNLAPTNIIVILKTVSSKLIKKEFGKYIKSFYNDNGFWSENYCIFTERDKLTEYLAEFFSLI